MADKGTPDAGALYVEPEGKQEPEVHQPISVAEENEARDKWLAEQEKKSNKK